LESSVNLKNSLVELTINCKQNGTSRILSTYPIVDSLGS